MKIKTLIASALVVAIILPGQALAAKYLIDTKGAHAFIQFRIQHLGYSWLSGRFNTFSGTFTYDENNPGASMVEVDAGSVHRTLQGMSHESLNFPDCVTVIMTGPMTTSQKNKVLELKTRGLFKTK